jgi:hypothetical protein
LRAAPPAAAPPPPFRSAPAQNAGPLPVSTITRTASSAIAARKCAPSSPISSDDNALRDAGESSVIQAVRARTSYFVCGIETLSRNC